MKDFRFLASVGRSLPDSRKSTCYKPYLVYAAKKTQNCPFLSRFELIGSICKIVESTFEDPAAERGAESVVVLAERELASKPGSGSTQT